MENKEQTADSKELHDSIEKKLFKNEPNTTTETFVAEDTVEDTIAKKENAGLKYCQTTIDVDNAAWNKAYAESMENNLERLKKLGLYEQLQAMGIVYDPAQFKRSYAVVNGADGKQSQHINYADSSYDYAEKQFDKMDEEMDNSIKRYQRGISEK